MPFTFYGRHVYRGGGMLAEQIATATSRVWAKNIVDGLNYLEREGALDLLHDNAVRDDSTSDYRTARLAAA